MLSTGWWLFLIHQSAPRANVLLCCYGYYTTVSRRLSSGFFFLSARRAPFWKKPFCFLQICYNTIEAVALRRR